MTTSEKDQVLIRQILAQRKAQADAEREASEDEPGHCADCNGSGEGKYDGASCRTCGGSGVEQGAVDDDFDEPEVEECHPLYSPD